MQTTKLQTIPPPPPLSAQSGQELRCLPTQYRDIVEDKGLIAKLLTQRMQPKLVRGFELRLDVCARIVMFLKFLAELCFGYFIILFMACCKTDK